jgi:hypothetical protein
MKMRPEKTQTPLFQALLPSLSLVLLLAGSGCSEKEARNTPQPTPAPDVEVENTEEVVPVIDLSYSAATLADPRTTLLGVSGVVFGSLTRCADDTLNNNPRGPYPYNYQRQRFPYESFEEFLARKKLKATYPVDGALKPLGEEAQFVTAFAAEDFYGTPILIGGKTTLPDTQFENVVAFRFTTDAVAEKVSALAKDGFVVTAASAFTPVARRGENYRGYIFVASRKIGDVTPILSRVVHIPIRVKGKVETLQTKIDQALSDLKRDGFAVTAMARRASTTSNAIEKLVIFAYRFEDSPSEQESRIDVVADDSLRAHIEKVSSEGFLVTGLVPRLDPARIFWDKDAYSIVLTNRLLDFNEAIPTTVSLAMGPQISSKIGELIAKGHMISTISNIQINGVSQSAIVSVAP